MPPRPLRLEAMRDRWNTWFGQTCDTDPPPNRLLVRYLQGRAPGRALDVGMGQGRNALHLASEGWDVTGVDVADGGVRIARARAAARGLAIETFIGDASRLAWGDARWDLVVLLYEGRDFFSKVLSALRPGGLVVVEHFHRDAGVTGVHDGLTAEDVRAAFAGLVTLHVDEPVDHPDFTRDRVRLVRYVGEKPRA